MRQRALVSAVGTLGTVLSAACSEATRPVNPARMEIAPADTFIPQGATLTPRIIVVDSAENPLPYRATLESSDPTIVAVTPQGTLRSVGPTGEAVITAKLGAFSDQMVVRVHDSAIVARLPLSGAPLAVVVKGDLAYVSRTFARRVQVLSLTGLAFVDQIAVGEVPCGIAVNGSGTQAYVGNQFSQDVSIIDLATRQQSMTIPVPGDPLPVAVSPSDSILFVTTNVNRLYKIDLRSNTIVDSLDLPATSHYVLPHPNDTLVYVATRDAGSVLEVNWRTMAVARTFTLGGRTQNMVLAPDRSELYVVNETTAQLHIITLSNGTATSIGVGGGAHSLGLSADGSKLYVGLLDAGIRVVNRVARTLGPAITTGGIVRWMAADPIRGRMIVANEAGWVDIVP